MLQKIESFLSGNKVFVVGILSAIGLVLQQYVGTAAIDWKVIGFAAVIAALSYAAKNLSGTVASIAGILAGVVTTLSQGGHVSWSAIILSVALAVIGVVTSGATSTSTTKSS